MDRVEPGVTHVVAAKDGTDKCLAARNTPGCVLVKATWLVECYWSMTRRDIQPHLMVGGGGMSSSSNAPEPKSRPHHPKADTSFSTDLSGDDSEDGSDDDGDDGDFAASFEDEFMGPS